MSNSKFYWGPTVANEEVVTNEDDLEIIDLGCTALVDVDYDGDASIATSGTGRTYATAERRGVTVRIQVDLGSGTVTRSLAEELQALVSFLQEGGHVGFALDGDYAFFAQLNADPARGDTDFDYAANRLPAWEGSDPVAGWRLYIQSPLPQMRREIVKVDDVDGTTVELVDPLVYAYSNGGGKVIVRHKYFFPFLRYVSGDLLVDEVSGGVYRFDCTFREDVGMEQVPIESDADLGEPAIWWDFETPGEFGNAGSAANKGSLSITVTSNGTPEQDSTDPAVGSQCCEFNNGVASFGFSLGGSSMMDFEEAIIQYYIDPRDATHDATGSQVHFCWDADVNNRLILYMVDRVPKLYIRRGGGTALTFSSDPSAIPADGWTKFRWEFLGGDVTLFIDGVQVATVTDPDADDGFTQAGLGNLVRWGRVAFTGDAWFQGRMDEFKMWIIS